MNKLKHLRESKGMTIRQLADELDINNVTLSRYENMKREPDLETLKKLASFYNVSIDYLLDYIYTPAVNFDKINSVIYDKPSIKKQVKELNELYLKHLSRAIDDPVYCQQLKKILQFKL